MAAGRSWGVVWVLLAFNLHLLPFSGQSEEVLSPGERGSCQPISIPLCTNLAYNQTVMPNLLGQLDQDEAGLEVHQFYPLVQVQCSSELRFFLCSIYAPVCTLLDQPIPPCRSLCERPRQGCEALMNSFGFQWPEKLRCENFPLDGGVQICVGPTPPAGMEDSDGPDGRAGPAPGLGEVMTLPPHVHTSQSFVCPGQLRVPLHLQYHLLGAEHCGAPCEASLPGGLMYFGEEELKLGRVWVGSWSGLSCLSTLLTLLTFLLDRKLFPYPERPLLFQAGCSFMVALAYASGFLMGDLLVCVDGSSYRVVVQGSRMGGCTVLFMLLYFFSMSSALWWVVLSLSWFLSTSLQWGPEAIRGCSPYFHLGAWGLPALQTLTAVVLGQVDGDLLMGICYVGVSSVDALWTFVLAPLFLCLLTGTSLLLATLVSLFHIRAIVKRDGGENEKLEQLMVRMSVVGVFYTLPTAVVVACCFYEQKLRPQWDRTWRLRTCRHFSVPCPAGDAAPVTPDFTIFMLKHLMTLIAGITPGFWIWSQKTLQVWSRFFRRLDAPRGQQGEL